MPSTSNTTVVTVAMAQGLASTIVTLVCSGRNMKEITLVNLKIARRNEGKGKTNPTESGPFGLQNSLSNKHKLRLNTYSERERERGIGGSLASVLVLYQACTLNRMIHKNRDTRKREY